MRLLLTLAVGLLSGSICSAEQHVDPSAPDQRNRGNVHNQENEILRRNADIEARLAQTPVQGVKKMSHDEGEKFFLDYWTFVDDSVGRQAKRDVEGAPNEELFYNNTNMASEDSGEYDMILPRHFPAKTSLPQEQSVDGVLGRRDFKCPTDTYACLSIGRPDRCCSIQDTCQLVQDGVGLCPANYETCPQDLGGGCCIPGYECVPGGCAYVAVVTITVHSSVTVSTVTYSTTPQTPSSTTSAHTTKTETTDSLVPPARPTSLTTATHATTSRVDVCPTGFYACSAVYQGGCCQTGRDCDTASCPKTASTTFVSDGVTVVEPVATGAKGTGACAGGWFSCADEAGGAKTTVAKQQETGKSIATQLKSSRLGLITDTGNSILLLRSEQLPLFSLHLLHLRTTAIMSDKQEKPLPFVYQFAAGAVAGVSEILVMYGPPSVPVEADRPTKYEPIKGYEGILIDNLCAYRYPLDVVKTRVQLQSGVATAGAEHYTGMFDCLSKIVKHEGFSRLYRGISAPILMEAPKRATKFSANDSWGSFYRNLFGARKQTQGLAVLTGATAGATEAFVVVPFELVKIRLQDKASAGKYNGMLDVVKKIVQTEGPLAMYNGLESTLWRHILWNAGYFGCIFQVRAQLPTPTPGNKSEQTRNDLIAGTVGGIAGTILNTPMDVVKSRIQNTTKVAGQEGFGALYKGFIPKVLRLGPGGGILLVVFTGVMDFFRKMRAE
ncbi:hypothetical protein N7468_000248 [Penicillium chermesinum]|uniref:Mitochondrial thiamine pyrophosphate carrier 1 n=1 Tax=Penicillium chermesinum TaxID=63820 RepID=A0A9W9TY91_9EURO|nr:uncharacterized protein N7468_000248 [Penicillium chermesinum]KAJ5248797.1 hypothetical protein N7468_000248 [Penicillium chermesinum]